MTGARHTTLTQRSPIRAIGATGCRLALAVLLSGVLGIFAAAGAGELQQVAARPPEPARLSPQAAARERVGVIAGFNPEATGTAPGGAAQNLAVGAEVDLNERIATGPEGQVLIWFLDGSSLSVGPNTDVVVDQFVFDPSTGAGNIALSACRGVVRYVGGRISKHQDAVTLHTPVGNVGVRGGVFIMAFDKTGSADVVSLNRDGPTVTGRSGAAQTLTQANYVVSLSASGVAAAPALVANGKIASLAAQVDRR